MPAGDLIQVFSSAPQKKVQVFSASPIALDCGSFVTFYNYGLRNELVIDFKDQKEPLTLSCIIRNEDREKHTLVIQWVLQEKQWFRLNLADCVQLLVAVLLIGFAYSKFFKPKESGNFRA